MSELLKKLTAALASGDASGADTTKVAALDAWEANYVPEVKKALLRAFDGGIEWQNLGDLVEVTDEAAQALKPIFEGTEAGTAAQIVLAELVSEFAPAESWVLPLLESGTVGSLMKAGYLKLTGKTVAPVVDASDVPAGGIQ